MRIAALTIMIVTVISKFLGFGRELILSGFYGATSVTDAYLISTLIPGQVFQLVGTAIATGFIPMFNKIEKLEGSREAEEFTNNLINAVLLISTFVVIFGFVFTGPLVKIFASGFEGETLDLAIKFTRISIFGVYSTGVIYVLNGFLQIKGNFAVPAAVGLPLNIIMIISIIISKNTSVHVLAYGVLIASLAQLVFVVPFAYREGYKYKPVLNLKDKHVRMMVRLGLPLILGVSVTQINNLIDRTLASRIIEGGISALHYASRLNAFVESIFVISVVTALYPSISRMVVEKDFDGFKKSIGEVMVATNLLIIPATVGALVFSRPIVVLLFGRGSFDAQAIELTTSALFYYSIGMVAFGLTLILTKAFHSLQDTKVPAINSAIGMGFNIVLNLILSRYMGIGGLALATSIAAFIIAFLLFRDLRKKIGSMGMRAISISLIKITLASLVMGLVARLAFNGLILRVSDNLALVISIALGILVYAPMIYLARIPEVDNLLDLVRKRLGARS